MRKIEKDRYESQMLKQLVKEKVIDKNILSKITEHLNKSRINRLFAKLSNDPDVLVVFKSENSIIAQIKSFRASERFGSTNWCISRTKDHWNKYVTKNSEQYFVWINGENFSNSLLGYTCTKEKNVLSFDCCFDNSNEQLYSFQVTEILEQHNIPVKYKTTATFVKNEKLRQMEEEMEEEDYDEDDEYYGNSMG